MTSRVRSSIYVTNARLNEKYSNAINADQDNKYFEEENDARLGIVQILCGGGEVVTAIPGIYTGFN